MADKEEIDNFFLTDSPDIFEFKSKLINKTLKKREREKIGQQGDGNNEKGKRDQPGENTLLVNSEGLIYSSVVREWE